MGEDAPDLRSLAQEAQGCRRCPLYRDATQTVFGEGGEGVPLMLVGEQPGDREDRAGRPFVGPAGQVLDRALQAAGIARDRAYVTNAVKHFKHEMRGKRRIHKRPDRGEVEACRWWLDKEIALVRPHLVVAPRRDCGGGSGRAAPRSRPRTGTGSRLCRRHARLGHDPSVRDSAHP